MDLALKNRLALVTGSSHGIGKSIAMELAREGANVILCGRSIESLNSTASEIRQFGTQIHTFSLDIVKPLEVKSLFTNLIQKLGRLDILVNNVGGVNKFGTFSELSEEDWKTTFDVNFMSMVYFCTESIPWLKKSDQARIINISSVPGRQPGAFNPHYSAAKAAMINLSKHLSNSLAKDNILVNTICPSILKGGAWHKDILHRSQSLGITPKEAADKMEEEANAKLPLGRIGMPEDIAKLTAFLAGIGSNFITGTCIDVDGGAVRSAF